MGVSIQVDFSLSSYRHLQVQKVQSNKKDSDHMGFTVDLKS